MGGVDLDDKTARITPFNREEILNSENIFYFLVDIAVVNSWVLMKKITGYTTPHMEFRLA